MPSSSAKKRRLRICEDSEESSSSSSDSDCDVEVLRYQKHRSSSTPETKTALAKTAPSSASSGGSSGSSFRLRRVPRGSAQKATRATAAEKKKKTTKPSPKHAESASAKENQPARGRRRPTGLSSSLASWSSDSDSDAPTNSARVRQRLDNKYKSSSTAKSSSAKKVPAKKRSVTTAKRTTPYHFDSDSDSDSELIGVMDFDKTKKKSPTTRQQTRQTQIAKRDHGIDPSLTAHNDSDDEDSMIVPAACLTIVTKPTTKKTPTVTHKKKPKRANPTRKRKPPAQPQRNNDSRKHPTVHKSVHDDSCSSDSSGESSNLRRLAHKCTTAPKDSAPPDRRSIFTTVDSDDDDSVRHFGSQKKPAMLAFQTTTTRVSSSSNNNCQGNNGNESDATDELFQRFRASQAKALSPHDQPSSAKIATHPENDTLSSSDESDLLPVKANENDNDDDSVDTVELDRRLRLSLGLPVRKIEEPVESVDDDDEQPPVIPAMKAAVPPSGPTGTAGTFGHQEKGQTNSHPTVQNDTSTSQQDQPEEEFVLPDCHSSSDSSSSSSSSSSTAGSKRGVTISRLPSEIGVPRSLRVKPQSTLAAQPRNNAIPPFKNPYSQTTAPVNPYRKKYVAPTRTRGSPMAARSAASNSRPSSQPSPVVPFATDYQQQQVPHREEMQETEHHPSREELEGAFFDTASLQNKTHFSITRDKPVSRGMTSTTEHDQAPSQFNQQERFTEDLEEAFFDTAASNKAPPQHSPAVVDLCDDDDDADDANVFFPGRCGPTVHHGLRVTKPSPDFNRRSREPVTRAHAATNNNNNNGRDEITYFSDENRETSNRARPRRVTDITKNSVPTVSSAHYNPATTGASRNATPSGNMGCSSSGFAQRQQMPFSRPELPRQWAQQPAKRQRIRDASKSNPFLARSVVARKPPAQGQQQSKTTGAVLPTKDVNVYYRQSASTVNNSSFNFATWQQQSSSASQQPLRNDLTGGSGVGAGSYSVQYGGEEDIDAFEEEEGQHAPRASTRGRKKAVSSSGRAKRPASTRSKTSKTSKKRKGKSKGGWGRGKRGGWGGKRSGGGGRIGTPMESQSDAFLANVGGASITF